MFVSVSHSVPVFVRKELKKNISYFNRKDKGPRKTFEQRVKAKEEIQRSKERNIINVFSF